MTLSLRTDDDVDLMHQAASGKQAALAELYDRFAPKLLGIGVCILKSREEAEDVLHDVFIEAWRRAPEYDARKGTVRAWFYRLMRSRSIDRGRSAGFSRQETQNEDTRSVPPRAESRAEISWLSSVLRGLPDEQRSALLMGYVEGFSASEIAQRTNVPVGTVKSRQAAGLKKIREQTGSVS